MEKGTADIALVTHKLYSANIETIPASREKVVFISSENAAYPEDLSAAELDPGKELRVSWMPEYDDWHDSVFPTGSQSLVYLEQMSMLEDFLSGDHWALMPASAVQRMKTLDVTVREIKDGPPDRITYYLTRAEEKEHEAINRFLFCLHEEISQIEGVTSFLK